MFNLVAEKYFDMNKKHAREALDIYKRFLIRMDRVGEFLKTAEKLKIKGLAEGTQGADE